MGTSTVHRSPSTPHWRVVNNLYRNADVPRQRLLAEVFRAAAEPYISGLSGPEALHGLDLALRAFSKQSARVAGSKALTISRELIAESRQAVVREGWSSFYGDLANRALHATILSQAAGSAASRSPQSIVRAFLGHLVATCVDHVVSRDLSAHFGEAVTGTASKALELSGELKSAAREVASNPALASALDRTAVKPQSHWPGLVTSAWKIGAATVREPRKKRG